VDGNPAAASATQRRSHRSEEEAVHAKALRQSKTLSTIQPAVIDRSGAAPGGLKRSKSMAAADLGSSAVAREASELGSFPPEVHAAIQRAVEGECCKPIRRTNEGTRDFPYLERVHSLSGF